MPGRRILSIWFPRLGAERLLRRLAPAQPLPLAVVAEERGARVVASLSAPAQAAGVARGQTLRDALALCPALLTRPVDAPADAAFLSALRRWAGRFTPLVAEEPPEALMLDITGCAHLFGGEAGLLSRIAEDCTALALSHTAAIADTPGAAWALARFGGAGVAPAAPGDAIRQEARATRSRAASRRPSVAVAPGPAASASLRIAPAGKTRAALAALPVAGLRLPPGDAAALDRLGLRRIGDLTGLPRAALARRFGQAVVRRLDQALGVEPEPISPAAAPLHFAVRLSFPEPIGLEADILAALDRMLPRLADRLAARGRGARRLRLQAFRADGGVSVVEVGLARPSADPARMRPLLAMKLALVEAGFGIDLLRLQAVATEPVHAFQHRGHLDVAAATLARQGGGAVPAGGSDPALDDLLGRIGARVGLEAITRLLPADSHIPEKAMQTHAAAWSAPAPSWPAPPVPRPLVLLDRPEPVAAPDHPDPPARFRWRRAEHACLAATGPERIAPEWWLDEPAWRSGPRDYWRIETEAGQRLWLFFAHGGVVSGGWFCHGIFA